MSSDGPYGRQGFNANSGGYGGAGAQSYAAPPQGGAGGGGYAAPSYSSGGPSYGGAAAGGASYASSGPGASYGSQYGSYGGTPDAYQGNEKSEDEKAKG
mmetsp:Transcript_24895/g.69887  ORF Transcript_24895/g.69887 Transcript_24895/m.69887 type:complete len:99 (-) Transcript_24895:12-308(-)